MGGLESHPAPIGLNAKSATNFLSGSAMRHAKFHGNTRRDSTTCMLSIEWQVNNGYQEFHKFLIKIKNKKHLKLPYTLSSISDQKTIFIPISHIAKSNTHKSIFGCTQTKNQSIQFICCHEDGVCGCFPWQDYNDYNLYAVISIIGSTIIEHS